MVFRSGETKPLIAWKKPEDCPDQWEDVLERRKNGDDLIKGGSRNELSERQKISRKLANGFNRRMSNARPVGIK